MIELKWLNLLKSIVNINSGSGNLLGSDQIRQILIPEFESLGFQSRIYPVHDNHKVLVFDFPNATPTLLLMGHLDTVFPPDSQFQAFREEGDQLIGPGIIDMKGGIVLLLNALSNLKFKMDLSKIRIIINDDEELGSPYSQSCFKSLAHGIPYGLIFEPGLPDRSIVTSESGVLWMELKIKGKAAHAGLEHQKGINAGIELAHKIIQLNQLTDYSKNITFSLGTLQGGTRTNVVCDEASAKIDIRYARAEDLGIILETLNKVKDEMFVMSAETGALPTAELKVLASVPTFAQSSTEALLPFLHEAERKTGQKIRGQHVGYSSDANHLAQTGMSLLVGLGPYGGGMHSHQEFMKKESYPERLEFVQALFQFINWPV